VSKHIDINQLLGEIGTSARSANDPWNLSRSYGGKVSDTPLSPAVVADLGASIENLSTEIQNSERIRLANTVSPSPSSSSTVGDSSAGSTLLGGLFKLFPFASGIAKLFGLGDSSPDPTPTKYQLPLSISFEGSMSSSTSGLSSLSYDAYGLPRGSSPDKQTDILRKLGLPAPGDSQFLQVESNTDHFASTSANSTMSSDSPVNAGIVGQLTSIASSTFAAEPTPPAPMANLDLVSRPNVRNVEGAPLGASASAAGGLGTGPGSGGSPSLKGQSILVQVQAMDSQSFMDHSQEIAQAVRQAMLNLNSLNDVILDL